MRAVDVYGLGVIFVDLAHTNTRADASPAAPGGSHPLHPIDIESGHGGGGAPRGAPPRDVLTADGGTSGFGYTAPPLAVLISRAQSGWAVDVSPFLDPAFRDLILACTAVDPARRPSAAAAGGSLRSLSASAVGWAPLPDAGEHGAGGACGDDDTPTADVGATGGGAGA